MKDSGHNSDFEDQRIAYTYDFFVKSWKIKNDIIDTMMRNPESYVSIHYIEYRL